MKTFRSYLQRLTTSKTGRFAAIVVAALAAIVVVRSCQRPNVAVEVPGFRRRAPAGDQLRPSEDFKPPNPRPDPSPRTNVLAPVLPPIRFGASNAPAPAFAGPVLPARRQIPCVLVNSVDSSSLDTPIIGLVISNIYWRGKLIIPKGTEVHGRAQAHHLRDRIGSQGAWTLVWSGGEEIYLNGLALDMDQNGNHWGPSDGTAGMKGTRERAANAEEVKLFVAAFLAGLTQPFQQRQNTILGSQILPTVQNAALSGVGEVIESYAERLLRTIDQESTFVHVAAGKTFYIYTLDPIRSPVTNAITTFSR